MAGDRGARRLRRGDAAQDSSSHPSLFGAGAVVGFALAAVALMSIDAPVQSQTLPLGLPDLPFHLRLDALSAFFLFLLGSAGGGISIFSAGYFRDSEGTTPGLLCLQYHSFLAAMALVLIADDAYLFMVAWETMALSSYFLVTTDHRVPEIRRAGFLYLLIAHIGAIAILLCFGVLQGGSGDYTFAAMRGTRLLGVVGDRSRSCSRCSASAPRPDCCRCTSGCPRRIRRRPRRCRR